MVVLETVIIYVFPSLMPFPLTALALASSFSGLRCCLGRESWLVSASTSLVWSSKLISLSHSSAWPLIYSMELPESQRAEEVGFFFFFP